MKTKIKKLAPVGFPVKSELISFAVCYLISVCYSLIFFFDRLRSLEPYMLVGNEDKISYAMDDVTLTVAASFDRFIYRVFIFFAVTVLMMCVYCVLHITYHYQNSKSIYLMKRLPDKTEYYVRCFTLPIISILLCAGTVLLLLNLFYHIYSTSIKPEHLPEVHILSSWRYFVWIK